MLYAQPLEAVDGALEVALISVGDTALLAMRRVSVVCLGVVEMPLGEGC